MNIFFLNLLITFLFGSLLSSCNNKKDNFDIDLSKLKKPQENTIKISNEENLESSRVKDKIIENKLITYKNSSEILNSLKFGKKDPFSEGDIKQNKLTSDFQLTGFLNTETNKYVFVNYLNKEGAIKEESIGGINTNLLPIGAKVISIDPNNLELIINYEGKDFIFEL